MKHRLPNLAMPQPQTPIDPEPDTVPHPYTNMSHHISLRSCIYTKTKGSKKLATLFLRIALLYVYVSITNKCGCLNFYFRINFLCFCIMIPIIQNLHLGQQRTKEMVIFYSCCLKSLKGLGLESF